MPYLTAADFDHAPEFERITVPLGKHKLCAYSLGEGDNVLMLVHGGPGFPSAYLQDSHAIFAEYGYRVVTWDQLGCGESDYADDLNLWQIPRFVQELEAVRQHLNLGQVHLLGQSWGGILGLEYCFTYQQHVRSLIMANSTPSAPMMERGFERLRLALGAETNAMMSRREAEGTIDHPEYLAVMTLLFYRHVCRTENWTQAMGYCMENMAKPAWHNMFGPQILKCNGSLQNWDRSQELAHIKVPVLLLQGEHDEITPDCAALAHKNLPNSELFIFRDCSHMPFYENPGLYQQVLKDFLDRV